MLDRVAIYCRLSEEDRDKVNPEDDSRSIQNQKNMLIQYATLQNREVYAIYSDDNFSGSDRKRPQFNNMIADAKAKKFDIILCKAQSRFTRELELVEKYINHLFPIWGIRFVSIVDNSDTAIEGNKKSRQINGMVNEWFLEDQSKSIKSVFEHKRKEGYFYGSFAPYRYKKDPNQKGHLIIDEEAAKIVRYIFKLYISGLGNTNIARRLNEEGVPNPTEYKRLKGLRYKNSHDSNSKLWKDFSINRIISNPVYIGLVVQGKQRGY
ncbi:MAG: recombinase family protein [Clostridiales bacterium]|nr:recombinase family protein [Clostridiales bacterium]